MASVFRFESVAKYLMLGALSVLFSIVYITWLHACSPACAYPGDGYTEEEGQYQVTYRALYGFCDENGKVVVSPQYYSISDFKNGLAVFKEQRTQLAGVMDRSGKVVMPAQFDELIPFPHGNFLARAAFPRQKDEDSKWQCDGLWGLIDKSGKWLVKPTYDSVGCIHDGDRCLVRKKNRAGFCDGNLKVVMPLVYEGLMEFSEGFVAFARAGKMGFLDRNGKVVVPAIYKSVGEFSEGLAKVETPDGWGFIDTTGRVVIPCHYRSAKKFEGGRSEVDEFNSPHKTFYIDKSGKRQAQPIPPVGGSTDQALEKRSGDADNSSVPVGIPQKIREQPELHFLNAADYQIKNQSGQTFRLANIYAPSELRENRLVFAQIKAVSRILTKVQEAKRRRAEKDSECADPYVVGETRKRRMALPKCYGFKNASGQVVIPAKYREATAFSEGLAAVREGDYWSYIDKTGAVKIRTTASVVASPFCKGLAVISKCSKEFTKDPFYIGSGCVRNSQYYREGLINIKGQKVCEGKYANLCGLSTERLLFTENGKWGVLDRSGKVVLEPCYGGLQRYSEGLAAATVKCWGGGFSKPYPSSWGFIDTQGKLEIPHKYDLARSFHDGYALVIRECRSQNDKDNTCEQGFIDKTGRLCFKSVYAHSMDFDHGVAVKCEGIDKSQSYDCSAKLCLINTNGEELTKVGEYHEYGLKKERDEALLQSEGLIPVRKRNLWGFIDLTGKELIKPQFLAVDHFKNGLAAVSLDNHLYFYIDQNGKVIVPGKFFSAGAFADGRAIIEDRLGRAVIDKTGRRLFDAGGIADYSEGLYLWKDPSKFREEGNYTHAFD